MGTNSALRVYMRGARHFSELTIWRLADELRVETFKLTSRPRFARDLKAQSQAEEAANSICRNIAEGFGCETHREFARFLEISRRLINELQDIFRGAQLKGHVTVADCAAVRMLYRRLYPALNGMLAHLRRTPDYGKRSSKSTDRREGVRTDKRQEVRTDKRK
jgi:four helix bundle protein